MSRYLYVASDLSRVGIADSSLLDSATERHKIALDVPLLHPPVTGLPQEIERGEVAGVIVHATSGRISRRQLDLLDRALTAGKRAWLHWPAEGAVEHVDDERLRSLRRHELFFVAMSRVITPIAWRVGAVRRIPAALRWAYRASHPVQPANVIDRLRGLYEAASPVMFDDASWGGRGMTGQGLYLRTDFWNVMTSGGSYGHTCYVARELSRTSDRLVALLPHRYPLLDSLGVEQIAMDLPARRDGEDAIATATDHYYPIVKATCQVLRPAFLYERLCLGNVAGAMVSRDLQIPYIIEYNGSELSIQRSFEGASAYRYHRIYLEAEAFAFRQATCISVVSEVVAEDLAARGVDAAKILVNPNGADLEAYAPAPPAVKAAIRRELGFGDDHAVVGFTATFGGWHGVDVLAAAIPAICAAAGHVRFLIIGDGDYKPVFNEAVHRHGLGARVRAVGRVPQAEGARLLKACDIYVAPHSAHMVDSRFFGSPTKLFEYMAMGGGIVASDLEQMGHVLSPALRVADLRSGQLTVRDERAVLCAPGNVDEFVEAVVALASHPGVRAALGVNSRRAVADSYSWSRHVEKLWCFARNLRKERPATLATGDEYKTQVQSQWNNTPVGSERARRSQPHSIEWFKEIEADRYGAYAPWMPEVMEFASHAGEDVLEIGGGLGIDLAQFAEHGARVTDVDLSAGHLALAEEHFQLRGLAGRFVHHDGEELPFADGSFDLVYSNGVIHHTPNTVKVVAEMYRVLRPGGRVIAMVYAENSLHYWRSLMWIRGMREGQLGTASIGEMMSRSVELSGTDARPLVKVYTRTRLRRLFHRFANIRIVQRQLQPQETPRPLRPFRTTIERMAGWNLVIKATKPQ